MGTAYNGLPGNVVAPAALNISSSTNASPIVIQTSAAHGMTTGDQVDIVGHLVNTAANGIRTITFVDATHFSLNGSTGNGAGVGTGTAQPLAYTGNVSLNPANADPLTAATWIPGMSNSTDRTASLLTQTGSYKIANALFSNAVIQAPGSWLTNTVNAGTASAPFTRVAVPTIIMSIPGVWLTDVVIALFTSTVVGLTGPMGNVLFGLQAQLQTPAGAFVGSGFGPIVSTALPTVGGASANQTPIVCQGVFPVGPMGAGGVNGGTLVLNPFIGMTGTTNNQLTFEGDWQITALLLRATGAPQ